MASRRVFKDNGIQIIGLRETLKALTDLGVEVDDLKGVFTPIAQEVAQEMRDAMARQNVGETGRLEKLIRPANQKNKAIIRVGSKRVAYAAALDNPPTIKRGKGFASVPANSNIEDRQRRIVAALEELAQTYGTRT